jgi:hypothetical protein
VPFRAVVEKVSDTVFPSQTRIVTLFMCATTGRIRIPGPPRNSSRDRRLSRTIGRFANPGNPTYFAANIGSAPTNNHNCEVRIRFLPESRRK